MKKIPFTEKKIIEILKLLAAGWKAGEMTSRAVLQWTSETGIDWHYIAPSKPAQKAFIESFKNKLHDVCSNENLFGSLADAIKKIEAWRIDYSTTRPHSSIGNQTPTAFAASSVLAMQRGKALYRRRSFVPRPAAQTEPIGSND
jgi:putative transposase